MLEVEFYLDRNIISLINWDFSSLFFSVIIFFVLQLLFGVISIIYKTSLFKAIDLQGKIYEIEYIQKYSKVCFVTKIIMQNIITEKLSQFMSS